MLAEWCAADQSAAEFPSHGLQESAGHFRICFEQLVVSASRSLLGFRVRWIWLAGWVGLERESDLQRGMAADEQRNAAPLLHAMRRPVRVARVG